MTGPESSADQARWQRCVPVEQTSDISAQMTTYTFIRSIRRKEALSELKEEEKKKLQWKLLQIMRVGLRQRRLCKCQDVEPT